LLGVGIELQVRFCENALNSTIDVHICRMKDWNDLKYFLAVAEHHTVTAAAEALNVNHTTISRRITALENEYRTKLVSRQNTGFELTTAGAALASKSTQILNALASVERSLAAHESNIKGPLRITAPNALAIHVLPSLVKEFSSVYPDVDVELVSEEKKVSLARRNADVAIRATGSPDENLIGKPLQTFYNCFYANKQLLDECIGKKPMPWISISNDRAQSKWKPDFDVLSPKPICCVSGKCEALAAAEAGLGAALLPTRLGDPSNYIARVPGSTTKKGAEIWLLYHQELRNNPRVQAFSTLAASFFESEKSLWLR